jgi:hypothetical protein
MNKVWKNYNLSIVLLIMFLISWAGQAVFQFVEFANEAKEHGQAAQMAEFIPAFLSATFENWQSEFLQVLVLISLTSFLIHKDSPESRDGQDRMEAKIDKALRLLEKKK